jgi:hypothetical protein
MACECLINCKSDLAAKKTRYLALINSLSSLGLTSDMSKIYGYILDDVARLNHLGGRMEDLSNEVANETAVSAENYLPSSVEYGIRQELTAIKQSNPTEYETMSNLFGIVIPDPVASETEVINGGE